MLTLGIDLSSQDRNTALCALSWEDGSAAVAHLAQGLDNHGLLTWIRQCPTVGIDAPFGWPERFRSAVQEWSEQDRWSPSWADKTTLGELRLRATDRWVQAQLGKQPLSVSSAGIAITAFRAAALLTEFQTDSLQPLDRVHGRVREVYPGAALVAWSLVERRAGESYQTSAAARRELLERMAPAGSWLVLDENQREACIEHDHQLDALVSALVARAAEIGLTHLPPAEMPADLVAREGWIAQPRDDSWEALPMDPDR